MEKIIKCKDCVYGYCQSLLAERWCTKHEGYTEDDSTCEDAVQKLKRENEIG